MFSRIFFSILILTCVYTYMLKSIKNNNDTNFQKLPDNFNFESNEIQTVKPNLNMPIFKVTVGYMRMVYGNVFTDSL